MKNTAMMHDENEFMTTETALFREFIGNAWVVFIEPEVDVDVDDYGQAFGVNTGETNTKITLAKVTPGVFEDAGMLMADECGTDYDQIDQTGVIIGVKPISMPDPLNKDEWITGPDQEIPAGELLWMRIEDQSGYHSALVIIDGVEPVPASSIKLDDLYFQLDENRFTGIDEDTFFVTGYVPVPKPSIEEWQRIESESVKGTQTQD